MQTQLTNDQYLKLLGKKDVYIETLEIAVENLSTENKALKSELEMLKNISQSAKVSGPPKSD